jgi:hypothetical protein
MEPNTGMSTMRCLQRRDYLDGPRLAVGLPELALLSDKAKVLRHGIAASIMKTPNFRLNIVAARKSIQSGVRIRQKIDG